jgi:hypothetical protein
MKIKHIDSDNLFAADNHTEFNENNIPTPDEAGERVRSFMQQHKAANKGKPGFSGNRVSPEEHERNTAHRAHDDAEQRQRDDRATAFEESMLHEISSELLGRYKTAAGNQASEADVKGDTAKADKRFKGIMKATNKQFDNDKKKVAEGGRGGINRAAPSQDVSYEKVLSPTTDTWKGDKVTVNELSVNSLKNYANTAREIDPATTPKFKMVKHAEGHATANRKIAKKTGDRSSNMYEDILAGILEAFDANEYADILDKQHAEKQTKPKPKAKVVDIDFNGWTIKYRNGSPSEWMILDTKGNVKNTGSSLNAKAAVADAQRWIETGGGATNQSSKNVTIDFNVDFAKEFAPDGETFYSAIDQDNGAPMLIFSTMPDKSLKRSHIRTQASKVTSGTTKLPMISMSPAESNKMGLQPWGRYVLGDKIVIDDNTAMFSLIFRGIVQGKGDMVKLGRPGLTVAHPR